MESHAMAVETKNGLATATNAQNAKTMICAQTVSKTGKKARHINLAIR